MRKILFRGQRVNNGEWVYGNLRWISGSTYIETCSCRAISVFKESVSQYTGIDDKNGKKVFEGDRVEYWSEYELCKDVVSWLDNNGSFFPYAIFDADLDIEITGDIHTEAE